MPPPIRAHLFMENGQSPAFLSTAEIPPRNSSTFQYLIFIQVINIYVFMLHEDLFLFEL